MRFLADMGIDIRVVQWLRQKGHDAKHLRDEGLQRIPKGEMGDLHYSQVLSIEKLAISIIPKVGRSGDRVKENHS